MNARYDARVAEGFRDPTRKGRPVNRGMVFTIVALTLLMMSVDSTIVATRREALAHQGLEFKLPAVGFGDVPIAVELRWADVVGMNVTQPRDVGNWFDCHAIVVSLKGRPQYRWAGAFLIAAFKLSNFDRIRQAPNRCGLSQALEIPNPEIWHGYC